MAMKILVAECSSCGDCVSVCPTQAIFEKGGIVKIKADVCNECEDKDDGPTCQSTCPSGDGCIVYM
ncbi:MAG: ferredoxin [Candidatus Dactylopiibacterium carminicum]|uniref:Ferredoxin n=1 Tax=Candidatus Dactylopiibacterium carminicum TaxID=857335 RepID=A0A272EY29_9RHOO|nr:4Fe-4S binding protein [Candidatus Dactylopiibacterium carminicum]KAF7600413.1 ferredoxin [Candidatus Dactylopiibacterium carminicum]PAS95034.1 MAG: ferredoxin [Candidatus Dactylopiibacterium carminicum]PAS97857.1 MAG: ferredoxin [Candidatus Dactylopiibacterium carminicum]PAT00413.1 MAG: ferredoxin [Candidatus Dactylopiibacterium carminicum]